jgi:hypothetical protein
MLTIANTPDGTGTIWLDSVTCTGNEASLEACSHETFGTNDCNHDEDAGVQCSGSAGAGKFMVSAYSKMSDFPH